MALVSQNTPPSPTVSTVLVRSSTVPPTASATASPTISISSSLQLTSNYMKQAPKSSEQIKAECFRLYGQRSFLVDSDRRLPPMLYTFPGSGNTWCRLLIEYATGIYTGSVYNDGSLRKALPGEFSCNWKVSAVKVHPHTHRFQHLRTGPLDSDDNKCILGGVRKFERAIILIRDPFDSIWSEYQRRAMRSHVDGIPHEEFNWYRWQANAASLAHAYNQMWVVDHTGVDQHFKAGDRLYVKYEDLTNPKIRIETLRKILTFLNLSHSLSTSSSEILSKAGMIIRKNLFSHDIDQSRLECAFALTEKNNDTHRQAGDRQRYMTKDIAYIPQLVCPMWKLFGSYANKYGYIPWGNMSCDDSYQSIPNIHVGPNGEYDRKYWRGERPIDFRPKVNQSLHPANEYRAIRTLVLKREMEREKALQQQPFQAKPVASGNPLPSEVLSIQKPVKNIPLTIQTIRSQRRREAKQQNQIFIQEQLRIEKERNKS